MTSMKLYYHPLSTFSQRVRIVLAEKSIPAELVEVDMPNRKHREPEFRAMNPYARVPVLVDGADTFYESTAIMEYLEAKYPDPPLVPKDIAGRARVAMYMKLADVEIGANTRALVFPLRFLPKERWNHDEMTRAREQVQKHFDVLDRELADRRWVAGNDYTLADICYAPFVRFIEEMKIKAGANVMRWTEAVLSRPSVRANWLGR